MTARMRFDGDVWELFIPLEPVPASRPRVGKFGTYYPKTYQRYMKETADLLLPLSYGTEPTDLVVHVAVHLVCARPKTGKLPAPRGDLDNYVKGVYDAITKAQIIWRDDRQIVTAHASKRYAEGGVDRPHAFLRASTSLGGIWLPNPLVGYSESDVYALPPSMRVSAEWLAEMEGRDGCDAEEA